MLLKIVDAVVSCVGNGMAGCDCTSAGRKGLCWHLRLRLVRVDHHLRAANKCSRIQSSLLIMQGKLLTLKLCNIVHQVVHELFCAFNSDIQSNLFLSFLLLGVSLTRRFLLKLAYKFSKGFFILQNTSVHLLNMSVK